VVSPPLEAVMIVTDGEEFLTAQEACAVLDIKPATLYSYVSRGLLSSYRQGIKRMRLYRREEVDRLTRLRGPGDRQEPQETDNSERWIPYV
jgi:excisionase family DNA binding protein